MLRKLTGVVIACCLAAFAGRASAQCLDWGPGFHPAGPDDAVLDQFVYDDGSGPALYIGGFFTEIDGHAAPGIARFNGQEWQAVGVPEMSGGYFGRPGVYTFAVYDDGSGPALFVGGDFDSIGGVVAHNVAKWTGTTWEPLGAGTNITVLTLAAFDAGSGSKLYAGGYFWTAGGAPAPGHMARWDGASWENFTGTGTGVGTVEDFQVFDFGSGPQLYACGSFSSIAGVHANNVARFDGTNWYALDGGTNNRTYDLEAYDDGSGAGPQLYAAGAFWTAGGINALQVARWDGTNWSDLDLGLAGGGIAAEMTVYDDGSGPKLYVGGSFSHSGTNGNVADKIAAWDGTHWLDSSELPGFDFQPYTVGTYDDGSGERLIAGGSMTRTGDLAVNHLAAWDGTSWSAPVHGTGVNRTVFALALHDDGHGPALYAGGEFLNAGDQAAVRIAKWTAAAGWSSVGVGPLGPDRTVYALASWDEDGDGTRELFATGQFSEVGGSAAKSIARWDGAQWSPLGSGLEEGFFTGDALAVYDDGNGEALYVAGQFLTAGGVSAKRIAKWDGASWSALGTGLTYKAHALAVFDGGSGNELYVGGEFTGAGQAFSPGIARWNGAQWSDVGGGVSDNVFALVSFDDGNGPALYVGGEFTQVGPGVAARRVARWDGSQWSALGAGFGNGIVNELATLDTGHGPVLYAGGTFTLSGSTPVGRVARWDGVQWQPLDEGFGGTSPSVEAMFAFDDGLGLGPALWLGGTFTSAGGAASPYLARWGQRCCPPQVHCTAGPSSLGCVPAISASGGASASAATGFTIDVANVDGERSGIVFYGLSGTIATPWGSSFLCVKEPTQRTGVQQSGGLRTNCDGAFHLDWNDYLATHSGARGVPFSAGDEVWIQAWYRAASPGKTTHMSDALHFQMCP